MLSVPPRRVAARSTGELPGSVPSGARGVILHAALKVFAEQGYSGASVRDIAAAAGVTHATLYTHYPSKEHLLAEITRIGHEEHLSRTRSALLDCQPDPREQVVAYVKAHVSLHTDFPMLAVVCNSELHMLSPERGGPSFEMRKQSEAMLTEIVERGIRKGQFHVPHVWLAMAAIGSMGLRVAYWYTPEFELSGEAVGEIYAEYALRLLGSGADGARGV
jgi:AcrR family transcriptional regulator